MAKRRKARVSGVTSRTAMRTATTDAPKKVAATAALAFASRFEPLVTSAKATDCSSLRRFAPRVGVLPFQSLQIFGEADENSFRPADVAEPIRLLVLNDFADDLRTMLGKPGERVVEVVHGEH